MGQLIEDHHVWPGFEDARQVRLEEVMAPIVVPAGVDHHQIAELGPGVGTVMKLHPGHHHSFPRRGAALTLLQHGEGLADSWCTSQVGRQSPRVRHHRLRRQLPGTWVMVATASALYGALDRLIAF